MTVCAVFGCHNTSDNKNKNNSDVNFHTFPSEPTISAQWTAQIRWNRNEPTWEPTKHTRICSTHFTEKNKYITKGGIRRLRRDAVPSENLPILVREQKIHPKIVMEDDDGQPKLDSPVQDTSSNHGEGSKSPSVSISSSIFDTPKEASLRRQLRKRILANRKRQKNVKMLTQKHRRLKKKYVALLQIVKNLQKLNKNNEITNNGSVRKCVCGAIVTQKSN